jgi:hypothetical protein
MTVNNIDWGLKLGNYAILADFNLERAFRAYCLAYDAIEALLFLPPGLPVCPLKPSQ